MKNYDLTEVKGFFSTEVSEILNNNSISGILKIDYQNIKLELMGTIADEDNQVNFKQIYGATLDGKFVVLLRCHESKKTMSVPGYESAVYSAVTCYVYKSIDAFLNVNKVQYKINTSYLNNNSWFDPFKKIEHDESKRIWIPVNDNDRFSDILINNKKYIIKRFHSARQFDNLTRFNHENRLYLVSDLLEFSPDKLVDDYSSIIEDVHVINKASSILLNVFCKIVNIEIIEDYRGTIAKIYDIRFDIQDNKISPQKKVWLNEKEYCEYLSSFANNEVRYKYITGLYNEYIGMYLGQKIILPKMMFLNMCGVVEDYYRNIADINRDKEICEFDTKLSDILSKIDKKEQKWLKQKLKYSNQLSFREVINELFKDANVITNGEVDMLVNTTRKVNLQNRLVHTRNWYTHYGDKIELLSDLEIVSVTSMCWFFIRIIILKDNEIQLPQIQQMVKLSRELVNKIADLNALFHEQAKTKE